jgi:hypothetical protein
MRSWKGGEKRRLVKTTIVRRWRKRPVQHPHREAPITRLDVIVAPFIL